MGGALRPGSPEAATGRSSPRGQWLHIEPDAVLRAQDQLRLPPHLPRPIHGQAEAQQGQRHGHAHLGQGEALPDAVPAGEGAAWAVGRMRPLGRYPSGTAPPAAPATRQLPGACREGHVGQRRALLWGIGVEAVRVEHLPEAVAGEAGARPTQPAGRGSAVGSSHRPRPPQTGPLCRGLSPNSLPAAQPSGRPLPAPRQVLCPSTHSVFPGRGAG